LPSNEQISATKCTGKKGKEKKATERNVIGLGGKAALL